MSQDHDSPSAASPKNSQGPDNPKTGKKKSNSSHCREPVALFSPYWLRLVIVRFCALHYRPFCHSDGYLTMFTACGWCHRTTTRLRNKKKKKTKKKSIQGPDNPKTEKKKKNFGQGTRTGRLTSLGTMNQLV